jgi:hypothetical protein
VAARGPQILVVTSLVVLAVARVAVAAPLPGSDFLGANGSQQVSASEQTQPPTLVDWQQLQAAHGVRHNPDPNVHDSAFAGGKKELEPGLWDLTTQPDGVNPASDNIFDTWSSVATRNGTTFLYLAMTREAAEGSTFLTFELNQDGRLWQPVPNGAHVPCRTTGDVLISFEIHGSVPALVVRRWTTTVWDAATGCSRVGTLSAPLNVTGDVQGAMNTASIANHLPGHLPHDPGTIGVGLFGEAAVNLGAVLAGADEPCFAFASMWAHTRASESEDSALREYVAPRPVIARSCVAAGTKFFDANANGQRDPGEPGLPNFEIWADYNNDGLLDSGEPSTVTDVHGHYVLENIRHPYTLRERLIGTTATRGWICSHPGALGPGPLGCGWGPIDPVAEPYVPGLDFGNFRNARLTVIKRLFPASDPGRFDLRVDGNTLRPAAGDNDRATVQLRPTGPFTVDETAAAGTTTNLADYRSFVACRVGTHPYQVQPGTVFSPLTLLAAQRARCRFFNIRPGSPAIMIEKLGPGEATAGDTLKFTLVVTNPGDVPFAADRVHVSDSHCDAAPTLVHKGRGSGPDPSPGTLDPGDAWTYSCSHHTTVPSGECQPSVVTNTGDVAGTTATRVTVRDSDTIDTVLVCRAEPEIPVVPPRPPTPAPLPPLAGVAGRAALSPVSRRCVTNSFRATVNGLHLAHVSVLVGGRRVAAIAAHTLQRRVSTRVDARGLPAGHHRVTARVSFTRGSDTHAVRLSRTVEVCARAAGPVTG